MSWCYYQPIDECAKTSSKCKWVLCTLLTLLLTGISVGSIYGGVMLAKYSETKLTTYYCNKFNHTSPDNNATEIKLCCGLFECYVNTTYIELFGDREPDYVHRDRGSGGLLFLGAVIIIVSITSFIFTIAGCVEYIDRNRNVEEKSCEDI
jgi:hypothetical protein